MPEEQVLDKLTAYAKTRLSPHILPSTPLLGSGLLKSVELARLLAFVHTEFGVRIPVARLVRGGFETLETIASFVYSSQEGQ